MSFRYPLTLGLMLALFGGGFDRSAGQGGGGGVGSLAAKPLAAPAGEATMGGNRVQFKVDGLSFAFRTPEVRHSRARVGALVVAQSFELANADNSLYARLVLNVPDGQLDLSGKYAAVSLGEPEQQGRIEVGEVVLAEETDSSRGRRMLPSGSGLIQVEHVEGRLRVTFQTGGDGLFRESDAAPVTGSLDFHWRP
jgi:hypothetical protein